MPATRYPGALWKPLPPGNFRTTGAVRPPYGMVLHIAQGDSIDGVWNWQAGLHKVSSYFIVGKDGTVWQPVDLAHVAWTEGTGNEEWIGVEHCGWAGQPLTDAQVAATAGILAWLHTEHGVPLQSTDDPVNGRGLGWHGMGAAAWGGHTGCPGEPIKAQRPAILAHARVLVGPPTPTPSTPEEEVRLAKCSNGDPAVLITNNIHSRWVQDEPELKDLVAIHGPVQTWAPVDFYRPVLVGPAPPTWPGRPAGWPVR